MATPTADRWLHSPRPSDQIVGRYHFTDPGPANDHLCAPRDPNTADD